MLLCFDSSVEVLSSNFPMNERYEKKYCEFWIYTSSHLLSSPSTEPSEINFILGIDLASVFLQLRPLG